MTQRVLITLTMVLAIAGMLVALGHYANLRLGTRDCTAADNTHIYKPGTEEAKLFFGPVNPDLNFFRQYFEASGVESLYAKSADPTLEVIRLIAWSLGEDQDTKKSATVITLTREVRDDYTGYRSELVNYEYDWDETTRTLTSRIKYRRSLRLRRTHVDELIELLQSDKAWATCKLTWHEGHYYFFVEQARGGVYRMAIRPNIHVYVSPRVDQVMFRGDVVRDPETGQTFHDRGAIWYARFHDLFRKLNGGQW